MRSEDASRALHVERLRSNRTDGASAMARGALASVAEFVRASPADDGLPGRVRALCQELAAARPSMAAVGNLLRWWAETFSWPPDGAAFRDAALAHVEDTLQRADAAWRATVARALELLPRGASVLTHSASGTVEAILAGMQPSSVTVTASEPGGEGRRLARRIGAQCIEDGQTGSHVRHVDLVLVGADAVLPGGDFINKVGTAALARAARSRSVPFHVAFESFKLLPGDELLIDEPIFERTPATLVTTHISDSLFADTSGSV